MANDNRRQGSERRQAHARHATSASPREDRRVVGSARPASARSTGTQRDTARRAASGSHLRPADGTQLRTTDADGLTPLASDVREEDIETLRSGQGARLTTRNNASEAADRAREQARRRSAHSRGTSRDRDKVKVTGRSVALIAVAVLLLALVAFVVAQCDKSAAAPEPAPEEQQTDQQPVEDAQQQATTEDAVTYQGVTFSLEQASDGTYVVMADDGANAKSEVFGVSGTPVALMMYNGTIVVPENTSDGWDVVAYMLGSDALPTLVVGSDGNPVGGSGQIQSATLDGSTIHVTDSAGATVDVALE